MKLVRNFSIALLFCLSTVVTAEPASESSLKELFTVTKSANDIQEIKDSTISAVIDAVKPFWKDGKPNPTQQKTTDDMKSKVNALLGEKLRWEKLEPVYMSMFKSTFSQKEVDAILAFYKTPGGQAVLNKQPEVERKTEEIIGAKVQGLLPEFEKIITEFQTEVTGKKKGH